MIKTFAKYFGKITRDTFVFTFLNFLDNLIFTKNKQVFSYYGYIFLSFFLVHLFLYILLFMYFKISSTTEKTYNFFLIVSAIFTSFFMFFYFSISKRKDRSHKTYYSYTSLGVGDLIYFLIYGFLLFKEYSKKSK